jgi:uncharacterized protein (TIGR04255 family)
MPELPRFDREPLVETVLGLQFAPIEGLTSAHLGLFWKTLGERWVRAEETEPVGQILFDEWISAQLLGPTLVRQNSTRRIRLYDSTETRMLQVENGWLVHNWRRRQVADAYPHFENLLPEYQAALKDLASFLQQLGRGSLTPRLWEVCYVNIIPRGNLWKSPSDWADLLPGIAARPALSKVKGLLTGSAELQFPLVEAEGMLQVSIDHVPAGKGESALRLTQLARGPVNDINQLATCLQAGRAAIVQTFAEITSKKAHDFWGRTV